MKIAMLRGVFLAGTAIVCFAGSVKADLIPNGNFASPDQGGSGYNTRGPGDTYITNFTVDAYSDGVQIVGSGYGGSGNGYGFAAVPTAGEQTLQLFTSQDGDNGGLSTTLTLPPGTQTLGFYVGTRGQKTAGAVNVYLDGSLLGTGTSSTSISGGGFAYQYNTMTLVATGLPQTLDFQGTSENALIQEISVTPEPATLGLLALGSLGLLARRRKIA